MVCYNCLAENSGIVWKDNRLKTIRMFYCFIYLFIYLFCMFVFKGRQLIIILEMKEVRPKKCGIKQCKQKVFNKQWAINKRH